MQHIDSMTRDCRLGVKSLTPPNTETTRITDTVTSKVCVGAQASGKSELKAERRQGGMEDSFTF